jgi:TonB-linked SusC/RagA family outer membrane protein
MKTPLLFLYLLVGIPLAAAAQDRQVTGTVTSAADNQPLPGANVLIRGTSTGTTTDREGKFSLSVPAAATLVFSYVGFRNQEVEVGNRSEVAVSLALADESLDEVVVIGYGTQKKSDLTGSVASVTAAEVKALPVASVEQSLQGRATGVQVVQGNAAPGGATSVRIRGGNSILGGNEPLYVIDGFPVYNSISSDVAAAQPSNVLASINPNDIESVEILKDASATAIYGSRGANGVVIITTKRGKAGKGTIDFEAYYGGQQLRKKLDLLGAAEYAALANERAVNTGTPPPFPDLGKYPHDTDWQDEIFSPAPIQNYTLSFSGGNENNRYSVSGNYFNQEGIIQHSGFARGSVRLNLDNQVNERLRVSTSLTASRAVNERAKTSIFFSNGIVYSALVAPPLAPVRNENGTFYKIGSIPTADPAWNNPVALMQGNTNTLTINRMLGNVNAEYTLLDGLTFGVRLGADYFDNTTDAYTDRTIIEGGTGGRAETAKAGTTNFLNENILTYKKVLNTIHDLNLTAGFSWQQETGTSLRSRSENFVLDVFGNNNLGAGQVTLPNESNKARSSLLSWIGRANYILKDKYLFTVTARADGSSRFGTGNKWGFFPSAALAWKLSEESFIRDLGVFSSLKLRTSYGVTGNQEIGNYQSLARLSVVTAVMGQNQGNVIGFAATNMANPDLKWETTSQFDVGLDAGFFNNRLNLTAEYYFKKTEDLLALVPLAMSSGFSSILLNLGQINNQGFELGASANLLTGRVKWDVNGNFSVNRNEVIQVAVDGGEFLAPSITSPIDAPVNIIREGQPLSAFYGYQEDGIWEADQTTGSIQPTAKAGDQRYRDLNGDGQINPNDRTILGSPYPDFIYGLNHTVSFKNFDFNLFFQGVQGVTVFNANKFSIADAFARAGNQLAEVQDRWTPENQNVNAKYPRASRTSPLLSERFFEDGSYLRLRNVTLGYRLPAAGLGIGWLRTARVYVSAQNLLTLTGYSGYDPEVSSTGGSDLRKGIDVGAYPSAKTYLVGVQIGL